MRDVKTAFFIAYKSVLKGNKSTVSLLIFILSLSFLNMLFISGIFNGMTDLFYKAIINLYASTVTIGPQEKPQIKQYIINQNEVQAEMNSIPGVIATTRRYNLAGSLSFDKDKNGQFKIASGAIVGIDPEKEAKVLTLKNYIIHGTYLSSIDTDQIFIASTVAGGYGDIPAPGGDLGGVKVGDKVQMTYSNGIIRTYTVKGIYNDSLGIFQTFITVREAESVLNTYNSASQILVKTDLQTRPLSYYKQKIQELQPKLKVQTYFDLLGSFQSFLDAFGLISTIVSTISILVAAITIFVIIYVNAINKRKQIGILKAIGIKQRIIILSYIFQSLFYSFCGIIIGSFVVFFVLTPLLDKYPIDVTFGYLSLVHNPTTVIWGVISMLLTGIVAGYLPSRLVAKQEILQAIWG